MISQGKHTQIFYNPCLRLGYRDLPPPSAKLSQRCDTMPKPSAGLSQLRETHFLPSAGLSQPRETRFLPSTKLSQPRESIFLPSAGLSQPRDSMRRGGARAIPRRRGWSKTGGGGISLVISTPVLTDTPASGG